MLAQPVVLSNEQHKDLHVLAQFSLESVVDRHITPLMLQEFATASTFYPIFFLQSGEEFAPVAVFGLKEGQNLFIKNDKWEGPYLPAGVRAYPFSLAQTDDDKLLLCVNEQSDNISRTEGQALFNADGKPTEFFDGVNKFFKDYIDANAVSRNIMAQIVEMGLLKPDGLQYRDVTGKEHRLNGFFVIDREKFEALNDEQFLNLRKFGVLQAIYAHFNSLDRIGSLIDRLPVEAPAA
ncbi:MAG: SapC family protein [Gammaproteobacteria bacterium]|jgi:hypothetical protein|nr:SapC family protein [Gammaproteobacteria bacterium]MBU2178433.1 SapC family protein [Gammaproteobacteria bacterium]MBU2223829.1 SapC family protein [Gammaproteobacteria bacterium]MBU2279523.1 SapC family protein [Gammaproteobacteria bacterium]MBU2426819.1 SapC family protein [Gammaproteobacteria bacterium]